MVPCVTVRMVPFLMTMSSGCGLVAVCAQAAAHTTSQSASTKCARLFCIFDSPGGVFRTRDCKACLPHGGHAGTKHSPNVAMPLFMRAALAPHACEKRAFV